MMIINNKNELNWSKKARSNNCVFNSYKIKNDALIGEKKILRK